MTGGFEYFSDREIVFWIVRLLFELIRLGDRNPRPKIAVFLDDRSFADDMRWPLNPLEIVDGIPFMVGHQAGMGGMPEDPLSHILWARRLGVIRDEPLIPATSPPKAAQTILDSRRFQALDESSRERASRSLRLQAHAMVRELLQPIRGTA